MLCCLSYELPTLEALDTKTYIIDFIVMHGLYNYTTLPIHNSARVRVRCAQACANIIGVLDNG